MNQLSRSARAIRAKSKLSENSNCFTRSDTSSSSNKVEETDSIQYKVNKTIHYFVSGEEELVISDNKKITVVIGISGSGKSTLLQFLTSDNELLVASEKCGELIIEDGNVKIGSTTQSHTKIPDLFTDKSGIIYYDMPGFGDTRDAIYDITTGYFIKKVIDHASHVKILLAIGHSKVRYGTDRSGLKSLLQHAVTLMPNIEKFRSSIGIVTTKIDRIIRRNKVESDYDIIFNIATFMESVQEDIKSKQESSSLELDRAMIALIGILTQQDSNDDFTNIGIFSRPYELGPLSEDTKLQKSKHGLQTMINNLKYTPVDTNEFKYALSDKSKLYINDLTESIDKQSSADINSVNNVISNSILKKTKYIYNIKTLRTDTTSDLTVLTQFVDEYKNKSVEPVEFIMNLRKVLREMKILGYLDDKFLSTLKHLKFLKVLHNVAPESEHRDFDAWVLSLSSSKTLLNNLNSWYSFINDLQFHFSQYNAQIEKQKYNIRSLSDWGSSDESKGLEIDGSKITEFLTNLPDALNERGLFSYNNVVNDHDKFNTLLWKQLNMVLYHTLYDRPLSVETTDDSIVIQGDFVKLSDVIKKVGNSNKHVSVFAFEKIFIDESITLVDSKSMSIIAPIWDVINEVEIKLIGTAGFSHNTRARDGRSGEGERGSDGQPGSPGHPSGNFVGIGEVVNNGERLTITTIGGRGGDGQHGGIGGKGTPGNLPDYSIFDWRTSCDDAGKAYKEEAREDDTFSCDGHYRDDKIVAVVVTIITYPSHCRIFGTIKGGWGGNGGRGGDSGARGKPGEISLRVGNSAIKTLKIDGDDGKPGSGGMAGEGGTFYKNYVKKIKKDKILLVPPYYLFNWCYEYNENDVESHVTSQYNGQNGANGVITDSSKGLSLQESRKPKLILDYKMNAYSKLTKLNTNNILYNFVMNYLVHEDYHEITHYVIEYKNIQRNYETLVQYTNPNVFYESLLQKVIQFQGSAKTKEDKIVSQFLVHAILATMTTNEARTERFVIDINTFVNMIKKHIESFKESDKIAFVNSMQLEFNSNLEAKIAEAQTISTTHLASSLEVYEREIQQNIRYLLYESVFLQQVAKSEKTELLKFEAQLKLEKILKIMKWVTSIISSLSPLLGLVKNKKVEIFEKVLRSGLALTQAGLNAPETFGNKIDKVNDYNYPSVKNAMKQTQQSLKDLSTYTNDTQSYMDALITDFQHKYEPSVDKLTEVQNKIKKMDKTISDLQNFEKKVASELTPFMEGISKDLSQINEHLQNKEHVEKIVTKWEIQKYLRYVRNLVGQFTQGFKVEPRFNNLLNELQLALDIVFEIQEKIDSYKDKAEVIGFVTSISNPDDRTYKDLGVANKQMVAELTLDMESNIIIGQYNELLSAVRQHVFPFAAKFSEFKYLTDISGLTLNDKANNAIKQIEEVNQKLMIKKSSVMTGTDDNIISGEFYSKHAVSHPFYVWSGNEYKKDIALLLSGGEILLKSDVYSSGVKNAVKFTNLDLQIVADDPRRQNRLDSITDHFVVQMTHSGSSHYKCDNKYFVIKSNVNTFEYSFTRENKIPVKKNDVFNKVSNGDLILSPYTYWRIKLIDEQSFGFNNFNSFIGNVRLELSGYGQYLKTDNEICNSDLGKYYTSFDGNDNAFYRMKNEIDNSDV